MALAKHPEILTPGQSMQPASANAAWGKAIRLAVRYACMFSLLLLGSIATHATQFSGTFSYSSGKPVNGRLLLQLRLSNIRNTCVTPNVIISTQPVYLAITNGVLQTGVDFVPSDCMSNFQTYAVQILDSKNTVLSSANWYITQAGGVVVAPATGNDDFYPVGLAATSGVSTPLVVSLVDMTGNFQSSFSSVQIPTTGTMQQSSDTFQRADVNPLAPGWVKPTGFPVNDALQLLSHAAQAQSGSDIAAGTYVGTWPANQYSEVAMGADPSSSNFLGPAVRMGNGLNGYMAEVTGPINAGTTIHIVAYVGGTSTTLTTIGVTINTGDLVRIRAQGTTITVSVNGTDIGNVTDSTVTSGAPGIFINNGSSGLGSVTSWSGGIFGVASTSITWRKSFPNTNYTASCGMLDAATPTSPNLFALAITARTPVSVTATVLNTGSTTLSGTLICRGHE